MSAIYVITQLTEWGVYELRGPAYSNPGDVVSAIAYLNAEWLTEMYDAEELNEYFYSDSPSFSEDETQDEWIMTLLNHYSEQLESIVSPFFDSGDPLFDYEKVTVMNSLTEAEVPEIEDSDPEDGI